MLPPLVEKKVAEYRLRYPEVILTQTPDIEAGELYILSRPLSMMEAAYHSEVASRDDEAAAEFVVRMTTLDIYSTETGEFVSLSQLPLGVYRDVYSTVVEGSGISSPDAIKYYLSLYRSLAQHTYIQATAFICKAFSGYTPVDIENMGVKELAKNIVLAELIHGKPFTIIDPEDSKEQESKEQSQVLNSIRKQQRVNDKMMGIDFSKENEELSSVLR